MIPNSVRRKEKTLRGTRIGQRRLYLPAVKRSDPMVEPAKWLMLLTNALDWGSKEWDDLEQTQHPVHVNCNARTVSFLSGDRRSVPQRLSLKLLKEHFENRETLYFTGSKEGDRYTLLMLDVDCHGCGTVGGAMQFLQFLRDHYLPGLYYEVSTNGNGGHGYVVVDKTGWTNAAYNRVALDWGNWLRRVLATTSFDVETVEIKGTCPVVQWGWVRGQVASYKAGVYGKYPRDVSRYVEWKDTTVLTVDQVKDMMTATTLPAPEPQKLEVMRQAGSVSWEKLAERAKEMLPLARMLLPERQRISATSRITVGTEEVSVVLAMLEFFSLHLNADGSMPTKRFKSVWDAMYSKKLVGHAWNDKVFAFVRNLLSDAGFIEWTDATYHIGRAAKWKASAGFWAAVSSLDNTQQDDLCRNTCEVLTVPLVQVVPGSGLRPVFAWVRLLNGMDRAEIDRRVNEIIGCAA